MCVYIHVHDTLSYSKKRQITHMAQQLLTYYCARRATEIIGRYKG